MFSEEQKSATIPWFLDTRFAPVASRVQGPREDAVEQGVHVTKFMKGFYRRKIEEPRCLVPDREHKPLRTTTIGGKQNWNGQSTSSWDEHGRGLGLRVYSQGEPDESVAERSRRNQVNVMGSRLRYFSNTAPESQKASETFSADRRAHRQATIVNEGLVQSKRASGILGSDWSKASNTLHSVGALDNFLHLSQGKPRLVPVATTNQNRSQIQLH